MELEVGLGELAVGVLSASAGGSISFRFYEHYLEQPTPDRPVLGQSFEDQPRRSWRSSGRLSEFFSNLLPEGAMRRLIAEQIGVDKHRELHLLARLGEDLPGAVTVTPLTALDERALPRPNALEQPSPDAPLRFSLAGVQAKFSVLREAEKFTFPARGIGGDWIVKLPDLEFANVPENEAAMMTWAASAGIDVPRFELVDSDTVEGLPRGTATRHRGLSYAVKRFDRSPGERVHIEDFAQVFTVYPEAKHDHFNYESIANVIAQTCGERSLREYVCRLVFMVVSGNADMHLKNWSLRYPDGHRAELSPAYDFVATVTYPDVKRELALKFSRSKNFDAVEVGHFRRMFERIGRDPSEVEGWVEDDLERILAAWHELHGQLPLTRTARAAIEAHQERLPLVRRHVLHRK